MKDDAGTDVSVRSRKRKANVAVVSTKETGGGGDPLPGLTWRGSPPTPTPGALPPCTDWGARSLTTFLSLLSLCFLSLGRLVCFLGGWGSPSLSFCRIRMKKLQKLTGLREASAADR